MRDDRIRYLAENMDRLSRRDRVFLNNPVIMQGLGLAPIVMPATNLANALVLALGVALLLTPTRMIATGIGQRFGFFTRAVLYTLTSGAVYAGVSFLLDYLFGLQSFSVGIYLPLLVLEPLVLKRYESPKRERLITSFKKGVLTTLGFCLVLFLVAGMRELLSAGTLFGQVFIRARLLPFAELPAGGFVLLGLVAALWRGAVNTFKKNIGMGVKKLNE